MAKRPTTVPADAQWIEAENEWEQGKLSKAGKKHGTYRYWRPDGTLCNECVFREGAPHGAFKRFHENGETSQSGQFVEGKIHGTRTWFACEAPTTERMHEGGISKEVWRTEMDYAMGRVTAVRHFNKASERINPDGSPYPVPPKGLPTQIEWRPDLDRWVEPSVDDEGARHGTWRFWTKGGVLVEQTTFAHGKKDGASRKWHENGKPSEEGQYAGDEMTGPWKLWDHDGHLRDQSELRGGRQQGARRRYDDQEREVDRAMLDEGLLHGPFEAFDPAHDRYRDEHVHGHRGSYEHGVPTGDWELIDEKGATVRSICFGTMTDEGLAQSAALASQPPEEGWELLALALLEEGKTAEGLLAEARATAVTGKVSGLLEALESSTIPLSEEQQDVQAHDLDEEPGLTGLAAGLLLGARPSFVFRQLAVRLDQKLRSRAALDFINAALLLDPEREGYLFTRGLVLMSLGLDAHAAADAKELVKHDADQGAFIGDYNRVLFPTFDFWPGKQKPDTYYQGLPDQPAQDLEAVVKTVKKYATRLQLVRAEMLKHVKPAARWMLPDLSALVPEGPVELEETTAMADNGEGEQEEVTVDETLDVTGHELPALLRQARAEWEALTWLCWAVGLDRVAIPTALEAAPEFGKAAGMSSQRLWRCRDKTRLHGMGAKRSNVPGFSWEGLDIDAMPEQLASIAEGQYAELQAMFRWLSMAEVTSPWQDGLRSS